MTDAKADAKLVLVDGKPAHKIVVGPVTVVVNIEQALALGWTKDAVAGFFSAVLETWQLMTARKKEQQRSGE